MSDEPDIPELGEAFARLSDDAQGADSMAALRRMEGRKKRNTRLVVLGSLAAAVLAVIGVATWTGPGTETVIGVGPGAANERVDGDIDLPATPLSMSGLEGSAWVLVEGESPDGPVPLVDGWPITLVFDDTSFGGVAACNDYGADASVSGTAITIEGLGWNDVGCGEAVIASEAAFFAAIQNVEAINLDGDELTLFGEASRLVFRRDSPVPEDALLGRVWLLTQTFQGEARTDAIGQSATLLLKADGTLEGSTGCRALSGEYSVFGASVNFTTFSAEGSCLGAELGDQDGLVVTVLGDGFTAEIDGEKLTLTSQGNEGLVYASTDEVPDPPEFEPLTIADLAGTQWTLGEAIGPLGEVLSPTPVTLTIGAEAMTGQGPCNSYSIAIDPDPERLLAGPVEATEEGCEDPAGNEAEAAYFAALEGVTGFSVSGEFLALFGPDVELNFEQNG